VKQQNQDGEYLNFSPMQVSAETGLKCKSKAIKNQPKLVFLLKPSGNSELT
jgi:hypothetical protein